MTTDSTTIDRNSARALADRAHDNLRVAHIIGLLRVGGAERHFVSLLNEIDVSAKYAIFVSPRQDLANLRNALDNDIIQVDCPIRRRFALFGIVRLARLLKKMAPDVVHTHMFWPNLYGVTAAWLAGIPVIVTSEHGENRWKNAFHRWAERAVISRHAMMRFCVSEAILESRVNRDGVPREKLAVESNGTPMPEVASVPIGSQPVVIGGVGRFVTQKNYSLFVDVIAQLRASGFNVAGCLVGDGPERQEIESRIQDRELEEVFELPGMVSDTGTWFRKFAIYLLSSDQEGQPIALLEAMSYGLPVVATDVGAISATLRDGVEGLVVKPGDRESMVSAISRFLEDSEFALKCGRLARKRAEDEFSISAVASRFRTTYTEMIAGVARTGAPQGL